MKFLTLNCLIIWHPGCNFYCRLHCQCRRFSRVSVVGLVWFVFFSVIQCVLVNSFHKTSFRLLLLFLMSYNILCSVCLLSYPKLLILYVLIMQIGEFDNFMLSSYCFWIYTANVLLGTLLPSFVDVLYLLACYVLSYEVWVWFLRWSSSTLLIVYAQLLLVSFF